MLLAMASSNGNDTTQLTHRSPSSKIRKALKGELDDQWCCEISVVNENNITRDLNNDIARPVESHQMVARFLALTRRWGLAVCLSLAVLFVGFELRLHASFKIYGSHTAIKHQSFNDANRASLIEMYNNDHNLQVQAPSVLRDTYKISQNKIELNERRKSSNSHPRVVCFFNVDLKAKLQNKMIPFGSSCRSFVTKFDGHNLRSSIPQLSDDAFKTGLRYKPGSSSEDANDVYQDETKKCKYADPAFQLTPTAPSTCNDVHAFGFDSGSFLSENFRHRVKYLTSGGFRSVWSIQLSGEDDGRDSFILKTNRMSRDFSARYKDQQRRDGLVAEKSGRSPYSSTVGTELITSSVRDSKLADIPINSWNNVLPVYHYCAFTNLVPFATAGPLDDYITEYPSKNEGRIMDATDMLQLALQAARGLYQMHTYVDGRPSFVHSDIKPAQFLLFKRPNRINNEPNGKNSLPILQISDFNRGRFLTRSVKNNETCPFKMCHVKHKGSLYRSPEEYMKCADQTDSVDIYSLGGVFFYLLSDGLKPYYNLDSYENGVKSILKGRLPQLPKLEEYEDFGKEVVAQVRQRDNHPAFKALEEIMVKCWAYKPKDRPSSLEVVHMLEEKLREVDT